MANIKNKCIERTCIDKGFLTFERNNFFCGKLMVDRDFWAEQKYHRGKQRMHNTFLHGWGVVCCLKVDPHPFCPNMRVVVRPGLAIDCWGREIFVLQDVDVVLDSYKKNGNGSVPKPKNLYICLSYKECETEPVAVFLDDCGCSEECAPNRIRETFKLEVLTEDAFAEGELDAYLYNRIMSGKKVLAGSDTVDLNKAWDQFDSGVVDGTITIRTSKKSFTSDKISTYATVQKLMDEINDPFKNKTKVKVKYDNTIDRFVFEHDDNSEVIILEQTGTNPLFFEMKIMAYHAEYHKVLHPCPECPDYLKIVLATIEGYDKIKDTHLDPNHADFKKAAYTVNNFQYRKTVPHIEYIDRVIHYLTKKGL